ncbi:MAG: glycosyltransferase, partial [Anaerolineaceae bacterium]|nr:glycosyltransferase [Anaerolineaceae bacterium]
FLRLERRGHSQEDRVVPQEVEQVIWRGGQVPAKRKDGPALLAGLKRVIREIQPDVIHAGPIQTCALLTALSGFHPLVSMSWGSDLLKDADRGWVWRQATKIALKHTDVLIGDCRAVQAKAATFGFPEERVVLFPWGVDLEMFKPGENPAYRERRGWKDKFVILSLRSWAPIYGVDNVVRAFARAVQVEPDLRLLLLGNGPQAKLIHSIVHRHELADKVLFGGQVSNKDLAGIYHAADLYVSASHSDGSSVSLMEALGCGLPVLVSDIPGNKEWITEGREGWLFPDGDETALAEGMLRAYEAREKANSMRIASRRLAEERADWNKNFKKLLEAYEMAGHVR